MKKRLSLVAGAIVAVSAVMGATHVSADACDDVLAEVSKARAGVTTVQGPFTQKRTISLLASTVTSSGHMWLSRPNRLRWELDPPDAATYWVLPDGLAYRSKSGSGRVSKGSEGPLGGVLSDLLVLLGGDLASLRSRYQISLVRRDRSGVALIAVPKDEALLRTTKKIELELGPDLATMQRVVIVEARGDRSEITFGAVERDKPIDAKLLSGP